jgi:hypothetical protein
VKATVQHQEKAAHFRIQERTFCRSALEFVDPDLVVLLIDVSGSMKACRSEMTIMISRVLRWLKARNKQVLIVGFDHQLHWLLPNTDGKLGDEHCKSSMGEYFTGQATATLAQAEEVPTKVQLTDTTALTSPDIAKISSTVVSWIRNGGTFGAPALATVAEWLSLQHVGSRADIIFLTDGVDGGAKSNLPRKAFFGRLNSRLPPASLPPATSAVRCCAAALGEQHAVALLRGQGHCVLPIGLGTSVDGQLLRQLAGQSGTCPLFVDTMENMTSDLANVAKAWQWRVRAGQEHNGRKQKQIQRLVTVDEAASDLGNGAGEAEATLDATLEATLEQNCHVFAHKSLLPVLWEIAAAGSAHLQLQQPQQPQREVGLSVEQQQEASFREGVALLRSAQEWEQEHDACETFGVQLLQGCLALLSAHFQQRPSNPLHPVCSVNDLHVMELLGHTTAYVLSGRADDGASFCSHGGGGTGIAATPCADPRGGSRRRFPHNRLLWGTEWECPITASLSCFMGYLTSPILDSRLIQTSCFGKLGVGLNLPVPSKLDLSMMVSSEAMVSVQESGIKYSLANVEFEDYSRYRIPNPDPTGWGDVDAVWAPDPKTGVETEIVVSGQHAERCPAVSVRVCGKNYANRQIVRYWERLRDSPGCRIAVSTSTSMALVVRDPADPFEASSPLWRSELLRSSAIRQHKLDTKSGCSSKHMISSFAGDIVELLGGLVAKQQTQQVLRPLGEYGQDSTSVLALYRMVSTFKEVARREKRVVEAVRKAKYGFINETGGRLRGKVSRPELLAACTLLLSGLMQGAGATTSGYGSRLILTFCRC